MRMRKRVGVLGAILFAAAATASANILVVTDKSQFIEPLDVVNLIVPQPNATTIYGTLNPSLSTKDLVFTSSNEIQIGGAGNSTIQGAGGGTFSNLSIDTFDPTLFFRTIQFNVQVDTKGRQAGIPVRITGTESVSGGPVVPWTGGTFQVTSSGWFQIQTSNEQLLDTLTIDGAGAITSVQFDSIDQFRVDLAANTAAVPEPASVLLLGAIVSLFGYRLRKQILLISDLPSSSLAVVTEDFRQS